MAEKCSFTNWLIAMFFFLAGCSKIWFYVSLILEVEGSEGFSGKIQIFQLLIFFKHFAIQISRQLWLAQPLLFRWVCHFVWYNVPAFELEVQKQKGSKIVALLWVCFNDLPTANLVHVWILWLDLGSYWYVHYPSQDYRRSLLLHEIILRICIVVLRHYKSCPLRDHRRRKNRTAAKRSRWTKRWRSTNFHRVSW